MITIRRAEMSDIAAVAALACELWLDNTPEEMADEIARDSARGNSMFFLAFDKTAPVGFCHASLRFDYVEGSETSPVGYLEGIYVQCTHRRKGIARQLLHAAEQWSAERGCTEFASDREQDNVESEAFHLGSGFSEANRIVAYIKPVTVQAVTHETTFWDALDTLLTASKLVIDRPAGTPHPRYPAFIYPVDYGYMEGSTSMDGGGIDVWRGSREDAALDAIAVTFDAFKNDSEIKLLLGCTAHEKQIIMQLHNEQSMRAILIERH